MKRQSRLRFLTGYFLCLFLITGGLFWAAPLPASKVMAQDLIGPPPPPDAARGLEIYAVRCAACHGPTGGGDGEMAPQSIMPPTVFATPDYRLTAVPMEMYAVIVNGRLERGMPPFGPGTNNPLSERDVWDLIAAIYAFSTPPDAIERGRELYAEHLNPDNPVDLTAPTFWASQSNTQVAAGLQRDGILQAEADLAESDLLAIVDYARTFSYAYANPLAPFQPIETAVIQGEVINGTTNEIVSGLTVSLRAFTRDLTETMTLTSTVGVDGRYQFDLSQVSPEWIYLASVEYEGFSFNGNPAQLDRANPALEMPVTVYESTTDPSVVVIDQLHVVLEFGPDLLFVSQLYIFSNRAQAIFIGESGNTAAGTLQLMLPAGAENVTFSRALGSMDNFVPALDVVSTETGWADTLPLRPGQGRTNLLVSYELPYRDGMVLAHPLAYPTTSASVILPEAGVTLAEDEWVFRGAQAMPGGSVLSYASAGLNDNNVLSMTLNGRPQPIPPAQQGNTVMRDENMELIIGGVSLLLIAAVAFYLLRLWQTEPAAAIVSGSREELLAAIADLDDAYAAGEVTESDYRRQRERLKAALLDVWAE